MDSFDIGQLIITIAFCAAPWMFPDLPRTHQIIFFLVVISISVLVAFFKLRKKYSELESSFKNVSEKHQALVQQFEEKQAEISRYRDAFLAVESLILTTAQSSKQDRLATMASFFEKIKLGLVARGRESR